MPSNLWPWFLSRVSITLAVVLAASLIVIYFLVSLFGLYIHGVDKLKERWKARK